MKKFKLPYHFETDWKIRCRLENQRKSIVNDENRTNKYIEKIKRLKDMNYIKKVDTDNFKQTGSILYLLHFVTAQAKFRIV